MIEGAAPPLRVHHLAVKARDLDRAEAFWVGVLGLPVVQRHQDAHGAPRSFWVSLGDGFVAVERAEAEHPTRHDDAAGWHCVALGIEPADRARWRNHFAAHGIAVVRETAYTLYVRDPEGTTVALSHYPHPAIDDMNHEASPQSADASPSGGESPSEPPPPAGTTARLAALVTLSLALLAFLTSAVPVDAQRRAPADVLVLGSSSVFGPLGVAIESTLEGSGLRVRRHGQRSTGFARPDFFDWQAELGNLTDLGSLRGVVLVIGGNDTLALRLTREESSDRGPASWVQWRDEARWREVYAGRVRRFVDTLCEAGVPRVAVVVPSDGDRPGWAEKIRRVQEAQIEGVRGSRCGVALDPRHDRPVRQGDTLDGVHLSTRGAREALERIGAALLAAIAS